MLRGCCYVVFETIFVVLLEFEEFRVIDLWDLVRFVNFTEKELESFRVRGRESVLF